MLRRSSPTPGGSPIQLEGFESFELIGSGGYSRVYRARQTGFAREVALKVLSVGLETDSQQQNFERECRAMGALSEHPNIVTVFNAAFTAERQPCIVMEFYGGGTLGDMVNENGPLAVEDLLVVGITIAGALETAHNRGVIHRDIKPQNLFMSEYGQPALGDFGISSFEDERTITGGGAGGGGLTVHYAPPELIESERATAASDVYSLAATLFTLATAQRPFPRGADQSIGELARRVLLEPAPRLPGGYGPISLSDLLQRAMEKPPESRPDSAADFGRALQAIQRELGVAETPLPLVMSMTVDESVAEPLEASASDQNRVGSGAHMVGADATVTVTRNPRLLPTETESGPQHLTSPDGLVEPGPPDSRGARSVALVACAVVLAAVGIVFFALTRPPSESAVDTSPSAEDTGESLAANDSFFSTPRVPEDVTVNVSPNGRAAEVSWASVEGAAAYQVERLDTDAVSEVVETATSLEFDDGDRPCVAVRAIGIDGKMSAASSAVCATP